MLKRPSLFSHVLDRLGSEIVGGAYSGTGLLPREQDLCAAMGASRTVVREVIRVLSQKGMLRAQQKIGVRVLPQSSWNLMDINVLDWLWRAGLHEPYIRDFLEFRLAFEPMASYQAALRATPEAKADILSRYQDLLVVNAALEAGSDRTPAIETDLGFHTAIYQASGNHLAGYLGVLVTHMMRIQVDLTTDEPGEFARGLHLHGHVAEAIRDCRADDAFDYSSRLVRIPYENYMRRQFPGQALSFYPVLSRASQKVGLAAQ